MRILNLKDIVIEFGSWKATEFRFANGLMQTPRYPVIIPYNIREDVYYCDSFNDEFAGCYYAFRGEDMYVFELREVCHDYNEVKVKKQQFFELLRTGLSPVDVFIFMSL